LPAKQTRPQKKQDRNQGVTTHGHAKFLSYGLLFCVR
jgi:hypothetical protein